MSGVVETATPYTSHTVAQDETNNFVRSMSLPPKQRKSNKGFGFSNGNVNSSNNHSIVEENEKKNPALDNNCRQIRGWNKNLRLFPSRKTDIRVSCFNPDRVEVPNDMIIRLHNAEKQSYKDVTKCNETPHKLHNNNSTLTKPKENKKLRLHSSSFLKKLQARFENNEKRNVDNSEYVVKTVEIIRKSTDILGIFIQKQKLRKNSVNGKTSHNSGIFISRVLPNSVAANHNLINPGVQIMAINTVDVSCLQVKVVAAIMSMLNHLILTIKLCHESQPSEERNDTDVNLKSKMGSETSDDLKQVNHKDNNDNMTIAKSTPKTTILSSVYDNEVVPVSAAKQTVKLLDFQENEMLSKENNIQSKFDESLEILREAIAGCDKQNSANKTTCQGDILNGLDASAMLQNSGMHSQTRRYDFVQSSTLPSFLNRNPNANDIAGNDYNANSLPKSANLRLTQERNFDEKDNLVNDHIYDEVPISDDDKIKSDSTGSYNREINVDMLSTTEIQETLSGLIDTAKNNFHHPSFEISKQPGFSADKEKIPYSSLKAENLHFTQNSALHQNGLGNTLPKFPVSQVTKQENKPENHKNSNITVEKKWEWLNKGQIVSEGLQKRIDVVRKNSVVGPSEPTSNNIKQKKILRTDSFSERSISESSVGSSGHSSESQTDSQQTNSYLKNNSDVKMQRNSSFKEKSPKSLLSVSPSFSRFQPMFNFNEGANIGQSSPKNLQKKDKVVGTDVMIAGKNTEVNLGSAVSKSRSFMTTSKSNPPNSRKKNWREKWKKIKKIGGSENAAVNELTCWTGNENPDIGAIPGTNPSSASLSTQHYIQKPIGKQDTNVLNRYHLDISMAHQRRISRQLLLNNTAHDPSIKPLALSQFKKYKHVTNPNPLHLIDGCLVITIYGVRELKKTLCEAYCLVQVDNATTKRIGTTMQTCRGTVSWNQCFEMNVKRSRDLHLTLYSWEMRGGKKVTSYATVNMPSLLQGSDLRTTFSERLAVRLEPRGTLYIKVALEHNSSSVGPLVFGADLQSIVEREKTEFGIPSLVHTCIDEVEKRGMQVVGIYRLCGSAIVKKDLRRKVEEGKTETEFSAEFYPDVNVITGILKDFLRELPQPLFPPELLESVTTAMEENPGPNPAAVLKEPFAPNPLVTSPNAAQKFDVDQNVTTESQNERTTALLQHIKTLSTAHAEKATLYALMNHLKRVAMHHEQNKMTCQNLAVCFGPVLLGPINAGQINGIDINAAIGFKRHIQVLNYMLSNWPNEPVLVPDLNHITATKAPNEEDSSNRMSCVSLTRRLSRVYVLEEQENAEEEDFGSKGLRSKCESLSSILETVDDFCDPQLDMYSSNTANYLHKFSAMESCDL